MSGTMKLPSQVIGNPIPPPKLQSIDAGILLCERFQMVPSMFVNQEIHCLLNPVNSINHSLLYFWISSIDVGSVCLRKQSGIAMSMSASCNCHESKTTDQKCDPDVLKGFTKQN